MLLFRISFFFSQLSCGLFLFYYLLINSSLSFLASESSEQVSDVEVVVKKKFTQADANKSKTRKRAAPEGKPKKVKKQKTAATTSTDGSEPTKAEKNVTKFFIPVNIVSAV